MPRTAKGASTSSEELNVQMSLPTDDEYHAFQDQDQLQEHYCTRTNWDAQREKAVLTLTIMLVRRKSACKTSAGSSKISDGWPHFWVQIWTQNGAQAKT